MVNKHPADVRWPCPEERRKSRRPSLSRVVVPVLVVALLVNFVFGMVPSPATVIADTSRPPFGRYGADDDQFHLPKGMATSSVINYYEDFGDGEGWKTSGCAAGPGLWHKTVIPPLTIIGQVTPPFYYYGNQPALDFIPDLDPPYGPCPGLLPPCYRCVSGGYFNPLYIMGDLCAFGGIGHCGNLTSPRINLYNVPKPIKLTFKSCLEKPFNSVAWVEISVNSGEFFILKAIDNGCEDVEIDLSGFAHSIIQLRWFIIVLGISSFATNNYGWVVDDVRVKGGIGTDVGDPEDTPPHRVYVADTGNHRISVWNYDPASGAVTHYKNFGRYGDGEGEFNSPEDVFVGPSGKVWVADTGNHRIQIFDAEGTYEGEFGTYYDVPWTFNSPSSIAVSAVQLRDPFEDSFLYVYVADTGNHRIQSFRFPVNEPSEWGFYGDLEGEFHLPEGIDIDPIEPQFPDGDPPAFQNDTTPEDWEAHVYVADMGNHRVQYFTQEGTFAGLFGVYGTGTTEFNRPQDVGVGIRLAQVSATAERLVDVYVADTGNHRIQYFDETGSYQDQFGRYGVGEEQFNSPAGVAVDRLPSREEDYPDVVGLEGDIFIMDTGNHRCQCSSRPGSVP
jgi:hypothetical protein